MIKQMRSRICASYFVGTYEIQFQITSYLVAYFNLLHKLWDINPDTA